VAELTAERDWRERLRRIALRSRMREGEWREPGSDELMERKILLRIWEEHDRRRRG
jgi:hypothetical protein